MIKYAQLHAQLHEMKSITCYYIKYMQLHGPIIKNNLFSSFHELHENSCNYHAITNQLHDLLHAGCNYTVITTFP